MLLIFLAAAALAADSTDRASWEAGTGDVTAIGFTEYAKGARVTTQYAGLSFTTWVTIEDGSGFTSDGRMLGAGGPIEIDFGAVWHGVAIELPTQATIELYDASDNLDYASPLFGGSFSSTPYFGGVTTSDAFSKIVIFDPDTPSATYIDNLYLSEAPAAPPPGPQLTIGGSCPGTATLSWSQLTPFVTVALVHGPGGRLDDDPGRRLRRHRRRQRVGDEVPDR